MIDRDDAWITIRVWGRATGMAAMDSFDHILNWKLKRGSRLPRQGRWHLHK